MPYLLFAAFAAVLFLKHREVRDAIDNFRNNFPRGGPPSPRHPLPAGDTAWLSRRKSKKLLRDPHEKILPVPGI